MENKKCFIVTPIGDERTVIRDSLDGLLNEVIYPILTAKGFSAKNIAVAHKIPDAGSINEQILSRIIEDDLNIVNLTGLNPNVMYELAIRHAVGKPVIIIAENGTKLPFDIIDQRTIFYSDTMLGASSLKGKLSDAIDSFEGFQHVGFVSNPVIKVIQDKSILNQIETKESENPTLELILTRLEDIEKKVNFSRLVPGDTNRTYLTRYSVRVFSSDSGKAEKISDHILNSLSNRDIRAKIFPQKMLREGEYMNRIIFEIQINRSRGMEIPEIEYMLERIKEPGVEVSFERIYQ